MARRETKFFNLSFLDVLSGAFGAILFLFIVVDKGAAPAPAGEQAKRLVYLDVDTVGLQLHGLLPDSLRNLHTGDSVIVVINAVKPLPNKPACPPCTQRPCPDCGTRNCPDPDHHKKPICPDPAAHKAVRHPDACPDPAHHLKTLCDSPDCTKGQKTVYKGDPIALAYKLGFSLTAVNEIDEIDLQVCFEGRDCVYGGNKKGKFMRWLDLKEGGILGKARAWNEIAVAEKSFEAGTYTCYARLSCKTSPNTQVELVVSTKKDNAPINTETFRKGLSCGNEWIEIGKVKVGSNYTLSKF